MGVDARREMAHIWTQYDRFQTTIGEEVVWFRFDTENSRYDPVYDEGGKTFLPGVRMPVLWVDQIEDPEQYSPDGGRRPQQRFRFAVSSRVLRQKGIGTDEAHGRSLDVAPRTVQDDQPGRPTVPWFNDRLNDLVYYDRRFYSVSNFQIRGRAKYDDVIIGVSGLEMVPEDETIWDLFPGNNTWGDRSAGLNPDVGMLLTPTMGSVYSITFEVDVPTVLLGEWEFTVTDQLGNEVFSQVIDADNLTPEFDPEDWAEVGQTYLWSIYQTYGDEDPLIVWHGVLIPLEQGQHAASLGEYGDDYEVTLSAVVGVGAIYSIDLGEHELIGSFEAHVYLPDGSGSPIMTFEVLPDMLEQGLVGLHLPNTESTSVDPSDDYRWVLTQTVAPHGTATVASGPFSLGAA